MAPSMRTSIVAAATAAIVLTAAPAALAQSDTSPAAPETEQSAAPAEGAPAATATPALPLGARVQLEFVNAMSSATATAGQEIALRLAEPITADGAIIVPAGTPGVGVILDVRSNGIVGQPGMISAAARYLDFNGERIGLQGMIAGGAGGNNVLLSRVVGGIVGVLIRGEEYQIAAGQRVSARLAGGPPEVAAPLDGLNPVPAPPPGKAMVVFYHLARMGTEFYTYGVAENGVPLARLRGNRYLAVAVDPGVHEFQLLIPFSRDPLSVTLHQEIFEGEMLFIRHDESFLSPGNEENFLSRRLRVAAPPTIE